MFRQIDDEAGLRGARQWQFAADGEFAVADGLQTQLVRATEREAKVVLTVEQRVVRQTVRRPAAHLHDMDGFRSGHAAGEGAAHGNRARKRHDARVELRRPMDRADLQTAAVRGKRQIALHAVVRRDQREPFRRGVHRLLHAP